MRDFKQKGITLIALVITIIILLILAGVTIGMTTSGTGLFDKAKQAAEKYQKAQNEEEMQIAKITNEIDYMALGDRQTSAKKTILYNGATDAQGRITTSSGENASRTLYEDVNNYDIVLVYPVLTWYSDYRLGIPAIIPKECFGRSVNMYGAAGGDAGYNHGSVSIDEENNKIIYTDQVYSDTHIELVIGIKF